MSQLQLSPEDFDFENRRELTPGSSGFIYAVKYRDSEVVVKVPLQRQVKEDKEVQNLARLSHENIVRFFGIVQFEKRKCVVLEFASRGSVEDVLKGGHLDLLRSSREQWMMDIARGLAYVHHDIVPAMIHCDVKSANLLVFDSPRGGTVVKISDFGQAQSFTGSMTVRNFGTQLWSAPEILARTHHSHSRKSDVWSFGITVIELFSEKSPYYQYHKDNPLERARTVKKVQLKQLDPLSGLQITWPQRIAKFVKECFHFEYQNRPTMKVLLRQLEGATDTAPPEFVPIRVLLPDGREVAHDLTPDDRVPDIARRLLPNSRFSDVTCGLRCLTSVLDWQHQRLATDWGLKSESCLHFHKLPQALHLAIMKTDGEVLGRSVKLNAEETFGQVLSSARSSFKEINITSDCFAYTAEIEYRKNNKERRSVVCQYSNERRSNFSIIDLEDGEDEVPDSVTSVICRVLFNLSPVPTSPRFHPFVAVNNKTVVFTVTEERGLQRVLRKAEEALRKEEFCAMIEGFQVGEEQPQFFWRIFSMALLGEHQFVDPSGQVIKGTRDIKRHRVWMVALLLLRSGDAPPFIPLPEGQNLHALHRLGSQVTVTDGRLVATPAASPADIERWTSTIFEASDFMKKLSAVAREKDLIIL